MSLLSDIFTPVASPLQPSPAASFARDANAKKSAERIKSLLQEKYAKQQNASDSDISRRNLEEIMSVMSLAESQKDHYRDVMLKAARDAELDSKRRLTTADFEPLSVIGRGAFGEVKLVRMRDRFSRELYAMKSMLKEAMILKNQVCVRRTKSILRICLTR